MKKTVMLLLVFTLMASCSRYGVYHGHEKHSKKALGCQKF